MMLFTSKLNYTNSYKSIIKFNNKREMVKAKIKESFSQPTLLTSGTVPIQLRNSFWLKQLPLTMEGSFKALLK